jgi:hypothetical protein
VLAEPRTPVAIHDFSLELEKIPHHLLEYAPEFREFQPIRKDGREFAAARHFF